ncbi:uncharacterized protein LOC117120677 [Anneissia japonica]|uniref:uncharacterized protein LOC117120677 n=1 Tax=Anneissia japonica TaxID=1529436 RepID=UPI001425A0DA|nr:uncharacterized protein LOC117120677 [Anneissia japonica]
MEGCRISNNWWKFSHLSLQLAAAIKKEDAEKFLEIYDEVMPKNLTTIQVDQIKERARELARLTDENFHQIELQLQKIDSVESNQTVNSLPTSSCINSKLATPESTNLSGHVCISSLASHDKATLEDHCQPVNSKDSCVQLGCKQSSLDIKNSLDLNACGRTKPADNLKPGPHFIASEPSEISLTEGLDSIDDDGHTYSRISFVNLKDEQWSHNQKAINYTSDESSDSLNFGERSLTLSDDCCGSRSELPSNHELSSGGLTTSARLFIRNIHSQQSQYRKSSFALVTDVKKSPPNTDVCSHFDQENDQVKHFSDNIRKKKKKKKKGKVTKMDDNTKTSKTMATDVSSGIMFDVFAQNNVKKVKGKCGLERNLTSSEQSLINERGLKSVHKNGIEIGIDVNNLKPDSSIGNCTTDPDELQEIVIMDNKPSKNYSETSSLCTDDVGNRHFGTFQPPFEYPPNTDKLTKTAMSLIDDKHGGSKEIEMQIMNTSLETPIQEDPRRKVQTNYYSSGNTMQSSRDLKSILKSTSSVCDDNAKVPATSVKERSDDVDMKVLSNNHHILSDELLGDSEGSKRKKKPKKKKKKDEDANPAEEDATLSEPERKLKSALAQRKDLSIETHLKDYINDHDNEPNLTAEGIRNIDKSSSKNCRTKKKREITPTVPPSIITNRTSHGYSQGRNQNIKKRLQEKHNAKYHDSAIEKNSDQKSQPNVPILGIGNTDNNKRKKPPLDSGKKTSSSVEFDWITDPEAIDMFGLTKNNVKDKKIQKKRKKTVGDNKVETYEDATHSDSDVKELKSKVINAQTDTLRKSASFDIEENASSSEDDTDENDFQVVESKKKKAAKKRVIFEDKSASFPRNMVPSYPKEKMSTYLASSSLRKCKSEPNNMTLVQDDAETGSTNFSGPGNSSGSQSSASSISTDPPSSQSYLELAAVPQPTPNTDPIPQFEFSYASKVKGASPKSEQTLNTKLSTEVSPNTIGSLKDSDNRIVDIDSVAELAGEMAPVQSTQKPSNSPTSLSFVEESNNSVSNSCYISAPVAEKNEQEKCDSIERGDKNKDLCSNVLINGINKELINSVGEKSSKLPGINTDTSVIGITFGSIVFHNDNSFSLEEYEENPAPGSPVDQLMASAQNCTYPTEPSTVITCTALENSLVRENSEVSKEKLTGDAIMVNSIGSFNHFTIAKFLQKEWEKVLEHETANPGCVVYLE